MLPMNSALPNRNVAMKKLIPGRVYDGGSRLCQNKEHEEYPC